MIDDIDVQFHRRLDYLPFSRPKLDQIVFTRFASAAGVSAESYICAAVTGFS